MFEPEELMARIVDLEEQLKVSEMAPPAAEQLIACLEGEIAKRDETIARLEADNRSKNGSMKAFGEQIAGLQKAVRNRERLVGLRDARILELEEERKEYSDIMERHGKLQMTAGAIAEERDQLRAELAAIKAQGVVMPEHETSTPSSKWASAGEPDPHGKAYDCERAELSMGEYTDDELANAVFMHDHRSFDIAATMRGEPGSIVLLTAAKDRIRWLSRSLGKALARLNAAPAQQVSVPDWWRELLRDIEQFFDGAGVSPGPDIELRMAAMLAAAPAAPAADAGLGEALDYQVLFDAIAAATSVYANGAVNISVQAFRESLAAHSAKGVV